MKLPEYKFEKKHNNNYFYKYTSFETAKIILENQTLRYSSPLIFNDPFDCQAGLHLEFNAEQFANLFIDKIENALLSNKPPHFAAFNEYSEIILRMREHVSTHGFDKAVFIEKTSPLITALSHEYDKMHSNILNNWDNAVKRMRLLCLSTKKDDILMWSHYADYHKGVVIELKVAENESEDDPLWLAHPIRYINKPEPFYDNGFFDEILGIKPKMYKSFLDTFGYVKYDVWQYENEWRVLDLLTDSNEIMYEDCKFRSNIISSIIFGCSCPDNKISELISLIQSKYSHNIKFQKAYKNQLEYKLDLKCIND